eukprot:1574911-Rhodomonas_salina.2
MRAAQRSAESTPCARASRSVGMKRSRQPGSAPRSCTAITTTSSPPLPWALSSLTLRRWNAQAAGGTDSSLPTGGGSRWSWASRKVWNVALCANRKE